MAANLQPEPIDVALIAKPGSSATGVGRYVAMLERGLASEGIRAKRVAPDGPPLPVGLYDLARRGGYDLRAFLRTYPIWSSYPCAQVYHLTSQNLASLLLWGRPAGRVVVTVHDIIPHMLRNDAQLSLQRGFAERLFDRLAMRGLRRADQLIADSHYTKRCIVEQLGIAAAKVSVVHLGVDSEQFRPRPVPPALRERYGLPEGPRYLIYVGSEDPRKNLDTLLRALALLRESHPTAKLIKVGRAHFAAERSRLTSLATALGLDGAIHFLDDVLEADLPLLYNLAAACIMPSRYEGFGLPVLEALACGTPVIAARAASLPELLDDQRLSFEPHDHCALAALLASLLAGEGIPRAPLVAHAQGFSWERTTKALIGIYSGCSAPAYKQQPPS